MNFTKETDLRTVQTVKSLETQNRTVNWLVYVLYVANFIKLQSTIWIKKKNVNWHEETVGKSHSELQMMPSLWQYKKKPANISVKTPMRLTRATINSNTQFLQMLVDTQKNIKSYNEIVKLPQLHTELPNRYQQNSWCNRFLYYFKSKKNPN